MSNYTYQSTVQAVQYTGDNAQQVIDELGLDMGLFWELDDDEKDDDPELAASLFNTIYSYYQGIRVGDWIVKRHRDVWAEQDHVFRTQYQEAVDE